MTRTSYQLITGANGGLKLLLNIEQYQYMNGFETSAGVIVLVTDPDDITHQVRYSGYSVSPGMQSALSLSYTEVHIKTITLVKMLIINHAKILFFAGFL